MTTAKDIIISLSSKVFDEINKFSSGVLQTRGGRIGSGMGLLIEALWGYYLNHELRDSNIELAWFPDHQYNDFVCLYKNQEWSPETKEGEALRIEVKSMNIGADESKAHFDVLHEEASENDLLLVIVWEWRRIDDKHFAPIIIDHFIDVVMPIIHLRDQLHLRRGGSFVDHYHCPDECAPESCVHDGEPLNASGKRERLSGPYFTKPSEKVLYAANFGGLIRMLKTSSSSARDEFFKIRRESDVAHKYISFIHRYYFDEELNQYPVEVFKDLLKVQGIVTKGKSKRELLLSLRTIENYQELLRNH